MAIVPGDWTVTRATGAIRYTGGDHGASPTYASVIQLRRWLGGLSDDESPVDPSDEIAIYDEDPADRLGTDNIIRLKGIYNIDDATSEHLYDGSIIQGSGDTETIYDGFVNFGNAVKIQMIENGAVLADDWWNSNGGLNPDTNRGISHRFMLPVRRFGVDTDGKRFLATSRTLGFTYSEFPINGTGRGNNTIALSEAVDLNNATIEATISGWTGITNTTEGYVLIDVNNDLTDEAYYSEWNTNQPTRTINQFVERMKWLTRDGSASTIYAINGELFRGITHSFTYDGATNGGPVEKGLLVWGTTFNYNTELASGLTVGENYTFSSGAKGQLLALDDDGTTGFCVFAIEPGSGTVANTNTFVRSDGTVTDGATVNSVPVGTTDVGGSALVLADDGASIVYVQRLKGAIPTDNMVMYEATLAGVHDTATDGTATVNVTVSAKVVSTPFIGASTGTALRGAYGVGVEYLDLKAADQVTPLIGTLKSPPDNQTWALNGAVNGEDRLLVTSWDGSTLDAEGFPAIEKNQLLLSGNHVSATQTAITVTTAIPVDTPASGTIRVVLDDGNDFYQTYTSWTGSVFTIPSTDYSGTGNNGALSGNNTYITYLDKLAGVSNTFTGQYIGDRQLVVIVRDGGGTPIKQFISEGTFNSGGGSTVVTRASDL